MKKRQIPAENETAENKTIQSSEEIGKTSGFPDPTVHETAADEDLLAETRRSLIEEQSAITPKTGMLQKVKNRLKTPRKQKKEKPSSQVVTPALETVSSQDQAEGTKLAGKITSQEAIRPEEEALEAEIQSLLEALDKAESTTIEKPSETQKPPVSATKTTEAVIETAHQILSSKPQKAEKTDYHELRDIALEDYQEPVPEIVVVPQPTINDKIENLAQRLNSRVLLRIIVTGLTILIILAVFVAGAFVIKTLPMTLASPTATPTVFSPTASTPFPMQIRLPGGWAFILNKGSAVNGKWAPSGPEWLEGTEICKWVSLPLSDQLEAVVKTLKPGDRIELVMTNYDHWLYRIQSIEEVSANDMTSFDKNYPSLLVMLTRGGSDTRLVILAVP